MNRNGAKSLIFLGVLLVLALVGRDGSLLDSQAAESRVGPKGTNPALVELTGEVRGVRKVEGELVMLLYEYPVTVHLYPSTLFNGESFLKVDYSSAEGILPGKGVAVSAYRNAEGYLEALKVTLLADDKLLKLREIRSERLTPERIPAKDARPVKRGR